jgi:hypothetical protein
MSNERRGNSNWQVDQLAEDAAKKRALEILVVEFR